MSLNFHPYRLLTLRWFTETAAPVAHAMLEGGVAACSRRVLIMPSVTGDPYWKSDMPGGVTACPTCEKIMAGG